MKKGKNKKKKFFRVLAMCLISVLFSFTLTGCIGMGSFGSGNSGDSGSTPSLPPEFDNPYGDAELSISDFNDVFLGAIGVYETDNTSNVFFDNHTNILTNFDNLINRQFDSLSKVIYSTLKKIYGDNIFDGNVSGFGSNVSFDYTDVINENIYNESSTLKYANSINGGYKLVATQKLDGTGSPAFDDDDNPIYEFAYSDSSIYEGRAWKNKNLSTQSIANALRYIYVNPFAINENLGNLRLISSLDANSTLNNLKNYYMSFNGSISSNENISSIGFSEEYMWNVLYYVAYSLIGESNINNSIDNSNIVFNGNVMNQVTIENYESFDKYKAYESILPKLISNAFKLVKNENSLQVSDYYCFDLANYNVVSLNTIFPILDRYEYIFFDDLDDICDAEEVSSSWDSSGSIDWDNVDYDDVGTLDPDDYDVDYDSTIKVGSLRKIKKIILIPKIDSTKFTEDSFSINDMSICMTSSVGELEVEIYANIYDSTGKKYNDTVKFEDGSYNVTLPDGTVIKGDESSKDNMVTSNNHLIIQDVPSVNKYTNMFTIFKTSTQAEEYKFTSVNRSEIIKNSFKSTSYDVASTGEKINIGRLKICNQLFAMQSTNSQNKLNKTNLNLSLDSNQNNYIEFDFKYFNKGGGELSYIPELYLLTFDLF